MGIGAPRITSRRQLGVPMKDDHFVERADTDTSAAQMGAVFWNTSGQSIAGGRAWVVLAANGSLVAHGECWNPNQDDSIAPTPGHPSTGIYTLTYAAAYPDEDSYTDPPPITPTLVPVTLYGARGSVMGSTANLVVVGDVVFSGSVWVATFKVTNAASAALVDAKTWLEVR